MRHIVIAGFAEYRDYTWAEWISQQPGPVEVWGVNNPTPWMVKHQVRADVFFQIHERWSLSPEEEAWIPRCPCPMYTCYPWDDVPERRHYPLEAVLSLPGVPHGPLRDAEGVFTPNGGWLSCSFCYALGLACLETRQRWRGAEARGEVQEAALEQPVRITLYGVELQGGSTRERLVEHAGVLWWAGYAAGLGIEVDVPPPSGLLEYPHVYGRSYFAEGDEARARVMAFVNEAKKERRERTWGTYDKGMRAREREHDRD